jgi:hypothetical protein
MCDATQSGKKWRNMIRFLLKVVKNSNFFVKIGQKMAHFIWTMYHYKNISRMCDATQSGKKWRNMMRFLLKVVKN